MLFYLFIFYNAHKHTIFKGLILLGGGSQFVIKRHGIIVLLFVYSKFHLFFIFYFICHIFTKFYNLRLE